jgi:hypothetical protein
VSERPNDVAVAEAAELIALFGFLGCFANALYFGYIKEMESQGETIRNK